MHVKVEALKLYLNIFVIYMTVPATLRTYQK